MIVLYYCTGNKKSNIVNLHRNIAQHSLSFPHAYKCGTTCAAQPPLTAGTIAMLCLLG